MPASHQAHNKHSATAPSPGKQPGGASLQGQPGWPGSLTWGHGRSCPPLCLPAWGLQPHPASSSFPCSSGHNEQPWGAPAVALPQAGWSRPSFPLTLCFPRAGGQTGQLLTRAQPAHLGSRGHEQVRPRSQGPLILLPAQGAALRRLWEGTPVPSNTLKGAQPVRGSLDAGA